MLNMTKARHRLWVRFDLPMSDDREAAAWVATLGVILNLDEFLTRE